MHFEVPSNARDTVFFFLDTLSDTARMLTKQTEIYANHTIPLPCDIYTDASVARDDIAFLYFHPGGLVDWGRDCIAPWLVQVSPVLRFRFIELTLPDVPAASVAVDQRELSSYASSWKPGTC